MPLAKPLTRASPSFETVLHTDQPAADRAEKMALYGRFVGRWDFKGVVRGNEVRDGKIYFGWVLEGRAIQDVWILPIVFHGTTLRVYDPNIDGWHILWSDPLLQIYSSQIGRQLGEDIVQTGKNQAGEDTRWSFSEIAPDSFYWRGEVFQSVEQTWELVADFRAGRVH